ncbi:hypothetical protein JCM3765_006379 [Sporobolomyces pararoseus]
MSAPKNAFAFMMQPKSKKAVEEGEAAAVTPRSPNKKKEQTTFATPTFKGSGLGAGPRHAVDPKDQPWVEKYRPKNLEEVSAQDHTTAVLKKTLTSSNVNISLSLYLSHQLL